MIYKHWMATTLQLCSSELVFIFFSLLPLLQNGEAQVLSHLATSGDPYPTQRGSSDFPPIVEPDQLTFVGESGGSPLPFNPALLYREGDNVANMAVVVTPEELAQALGNQAVNAIQLDAAIELAEPIFGMKPISVLRDLLLMGPGELSSSLGREKEWLSLEKGHLGLMGIRLGPGLVEVGHDEGHMPLTLVGVNLYGAGFQEGDAGNYCRCTQLSIISSVMDAAIAPHRLDKMDITPREIMEDASNGDTPTPFSESILMQSIFTRDRWTFLDFKKVRMSTGES